MFDQPKLRNTYFQSNASKLLLAVMESRHDSDAAERVLRNMSHMSGGPKQLVKAIVQAYDMSSSSDFQVTMVKQQLLAHHVRLTYQTKLPSLHRL